MNELVKHRKLFVDIRNSTIDFGGQNTRKLFELLKSISLTSLFSISDVSEFVRVIVNAKIKGINETTLIEILLEFQVICNITLTTEEQDEFLGLMFSAASIIDDPLIPDQLSSVGTPTDQTAFLRTLCLMRLMS